MHGLLDRAAQLTNLKIETPRPEPLTREMALPAHAVRARIACAGVKCGMDVLGTAPPFKISPKPRCIR
jgi:hypothetical protein